MHPAQLVAEACQLARNNYDLTWSDYDWDGDGEIEQVYVIYAGYGEHAGAAPNTIWPHEWTLEDAQRYNDGDGPISIDGCTINTYAISSELSGAVGSTMNSVGVACHEFSHCLGLPDFYSTNYSKSFGMGAWDIMSHGEYNGPNGRGECPPPFTAYERWFCGWFEPIVLKSDQAITEMPDLQDEPVAYLIRNEAYPSEYFLLENRQPNRWGTYVDKSTGMHGMLVCHVDEDEDAWRLNRVNTSSSHPRMTIIPANQTYGSWRSSEYDTSETQYRGQPFPGSQDVTVLDSLSHPQYAGTLFHNNTHGTRALPFTLSNISESDGLISFQFSIPGNQSLPDAIKMIRTEEKGKRSNSILFPITSDIYITQGGEKVLIR
jgi:M6 family metalloprotease-like protein